MVNKLEELRRNLDNNRQVHVQMVYLDEGDIAAFYAKKERGLTPLGGLPKFVSTGDLAHGAFAGIGYRLTVEHLVFRVDKMMVALGALGILGASTDLLFARFTAGIVARYGGRK